MGNFELVVPGNGGFAHFWRNNDRGGVPWIGSDIFDRTRVDAAALIQSNYGNPGNLEVVARRGDRLLHYWRECVWPFRWHGPFEFARGVAGSPGFIQGRHGAKGNFEVVTPMASGGLAHFWRNNDVASMPWHGPTRFSGGNFSGAALIQGTYGRPGNLEVVAVTGNRICHFWRIDRYPWTWNGPIDFGSGVTGAPALIQGTFGSVGNFEVVVPRAAGGLVHYWRNNDAASMPWSGPTAFGSGAASAASLVQSTFGPGNLEVVAIQGAQKGFYWRLNGPPWTWSRRANILTDCVRVHVKVLTAPNVDVDTVLAEMGNVFADQNVQSVRASTENLNLPLLNTVDVGNCTMGNTTAEQNTLFGNRNNVQANEVVLYFLLATNPASNGCAAFPANRPGAVVAQGATRWTTGHEVGHVLGLNHVNNNDRLMTGNGTGNITNAPPDLVGTEGTTMRNNGLTPQW